MNAEQYISYMDESGAIPGIQWDGTVTDWVKETFEAAPMQKHNLSISGGNEKSTYLMSLSFLNQDGIVKVTMITIKDIPGCLTEARR